MLKKQAKDSKRITVGEDKAYDTSDHIAALRSARRYGRKI
jgi:hypothetical protein